MAATPELLDQPDPRRPVERLLFSYDGDHQHPTNRAIHTVCVPAIVWSVTGFFWAIPVPELIGRTGFWMALMMFLAWTWYWRMSRPLAIGILISFVAFGVINRVIDVYFGTMAVLWSAVVVFVVAWIGQFIGHKIEGKRPSFFTDLVYLLVGPMWTLKKLYDRLGIAV